MSGIQPRRSALYLPASNARAIEKAGQLDCDVVILDLEDAVAPEAKDGARANAVEAIRGAGFGRRELVVRVNGLETPWGEEDLRAISAAGPDAILVPKVSDAGDVRRYDRAIDSAPASMQLWAMIETAACLFHLSEIGATASETRLSMFVLGTNDLAKETGATLTVKRDPFLGALGLAVAAARAHGLGILDGVFNDLENQAGFAAQCTQGAEFGFDGKTLVHPRQIEPCNTAFSPAPEALAWAQTVIDAFDLPENEAKGAIRVDGRMVERLHLAQARRALAIQAAIATTNN